MILARMTLILIGVFAHTLAGPSAQAPTAADVPRLLAQLRSPDPSARGLAEMQLDAIRDPDAVPPLLEALSRDVRLRPVLFRLLANFRDVRKTPVYIQLARSGDQTFPAWSDPIVQQLKELGTPAAAALMESFESPCQESYVEWVGSALAEFDDAVTIALRGLATEGDECQQGAAEDALMMIYRPGSDQSPDEGQGIQVLTVAAQSGSQAVRLVAQEWIQRNITQDNRDFNTILGPLERTYHRARRASTRVAVLRALEVYPVSDQTVTDLMREGSRDGSADVRAAARKWLTEHAPPPAPKAPGPANTVRAKLARLKQLGEQEDAADTPRAAAFLSDSDPRVREAAAEAIGKIDAAAVDPRGHDERERDTADANAALVRALGDSDARVRAAAVSALGEVNNQPFGGVGDNEVTKALIPLANDPAPSVQAAVAEVLGKLNDPGAVPELVRLVSSADLTVRRLAVNAIERFDQKEATCAKVRLLKDADQSIRYLAAMGLFSAFMDGTRCPGDVEALIEALKDPQQSEWVRLPLGRLKDARAVAPLVQDLTARGEPRSSYCHVCQALQEIGDPSAIQPLLPLLNSGNPVVARGVADMLSAFNDPRAIGALAELLKDNRPEMRESAIAGLTTLQQCRFAPEFRHALTDESPLVRQKAAGAAAACKDVEAVDALVNLLRFEPRAAALALGVIGDARAVPALIALLNDPKKADRTAAATALGALRDRRAVDPLLEALRDSAPDHVPAAIEAARALGEIRDPRATAPLQEIVAAAPRFGYSAPADAAEEALKKLGAPVPARQGR